MKEDPILEEIHGAGKKLLEESGGDVQKLMDRLKSLEADEPDRIVSRDQLKARLGAKAPR